jgi:hypothetical protein
MTFSAGAIASEDPQLVFTAGFKRISFGPAISETGNGIVIMYKIK